MALFVLLDVSTLWQVAPRGCLGLLVKKYEDVEGEEMVVEGFERKRTAFEARGVKAGDVVVGVGDVSVVGLPYSRVMRMIGAAKTQGRVDLSFLSVCGHSIMLSEDQVKNPLPPRHRSPWPRSQAAAAMVID